MVKVKDQDEHRQQPEVSTRKVTGGLREEEVCQIFNLKENLDYSDILIKYANKYLKLGWDLVAVNSLGEADLELDFREAEEIWSPKVTAFGLEGVQVNLGVRTGSPSRLVVLEIHRTESQSPFNQRGEWGSGCVAEVGTDREQHYYVVPRGWQPPASYFLESFQIMIFGEEGMVLAPPSLEPKAQATLRWLRPPWENPPTRPSPALCKFLQESVPSLQEPLQPKVPQVLTWAEVYPRITSYPSILQALLAPAPTPEDYYQSLIAAAQGVGLKDSQVLLGLLWHAPLGDAGHPPQRWEYFQRLVRQSAAEPPEGLLSERPKSRAKSLPPTSSIMGDNGATPGEDLFFGVPGEETLPGAGFPSPSPAPAAPSAGAGRCRPGSRRANGDGAAASQEVGEEIYERWSELFRLNGDNLVVDRRRYEAMIYELGKLGAWQEFFKRQQRENRLLRNKIEAQWEKELDFFRQLSFKRDKKGWRK